MTFSFKEKSVITVLIVLAIAYGFYFTTILKSLQSAPDTTHAVSGILFIIVTIMVIIAMTVSHIGIALFNVKDAGNGEDERDRFIEIKAEARSSFVLGAGAFFGSVAGIFQLLPPFLIGNLIFFFLVLSEITKGFLQLYYYRRGVLNG